jgi:methyl-accepting chemotaxis protein
MSSSRFLAAVLLAPVLLVTPALAVDGSDPVQHAESNWSYRWGDPQRTASGVPVVADGDWKPLVAFATPPGADPHGILWIRVPLPSGAWRNPSLFLGAVAGALEVYDATGLKASIGTVNPSGVETPGGGTWLLAELAETHEVYLRCQSTLMGGPGPQRSVLVGDRSGLERALLRRELPVAVVAIVLLFSGLVALCGYAWRRSDVAVAAFATFSLACGAMLLGMEGAGRLIHADWGLWSRCGLVGGLLFVPALCWFVEAVRVAPQATWLQPLTRLLFAIASIAAVYDVYDPELSQGKVLFIVLVAGVGLAVSVALTAQSALAGHPEARVLLVGFAVLVVTFVTDAAPFTRGRTPDGYTLQWGLLSIAACIATIASRRLSAVISELADRTSLLEEREAQSRVVNARIVDGSGRLISVVDTLRASANVHSSGMSRQASALHETQVTAEEIKRTSAMAAEKAKALLAGATEADEVGKHGDAAVTASLAGIESIGAEVAEMARQIALVDQRATEIAGIVETVKDLADQSNMLALNAAIVAVRAGEHGKGFSIVAREVRRLADQSLQATQRIRQVLDGVSTSLRQAVDTSGRSQARIAASLGLVRASGEKLQQLGAIVRDSGHGVRQISAAITQQNAGVSQIFQAIEDLSRHMQDTMDRLRETEAATAQVQQVSETLRTDANVVAA